MTVSIDNIDFADGDGDPTAAVAALQEARSRTHGLVARVCDEDLQRVHSTLMSPLVWDLGHIAAFEDLWINHRWGGLPLLREGLADVYDAFETPRAGRGELPFLGPDDARRYLHEVRARAEATLRRRGLADGGGVLAEMVLRHEQQHNETMLQTLELAHLPGFTPVPPSTAAGAERHTGLELVEIAGGPVAIGAPDAGFAYDNERPRHRTAVRDYLIGRTPVTNASWLAFVHDGGYARREWWSDEGWAWRERHDVTRPAEWTVDLQAEWRLGTRAPIDGDRPVVHVSWFEADAFARAHGARLPTEAEWERAATWDRAMPRAHPWGDLPATPGIHANVDQLTGGTLPAGTLTAGAAPSGCLGMIGDVWEWCATEFDGYPGFRPFPYPEYSQVFFRGGYRVLRGGSWATRARVATTSFRNWDLPERRQIFAGVRIARDA